MTSFNLILRSVSFARSFPPKVSSGARARGALGTETLRKIQCRKFRASIHFQSTPVTSFERVISGVSSLARVAWGRTVERLRTIFALRFVPVFPVNAGTSVRDLNLRGAFSALRSLLLRSLVQHPEKSGRSVFHGLQVSPGGFPFDAHLTRSAGSSGLVAHSDGHRDSERKIGNVRKSSGEIRNVIR